jgi:hypothetical protein
MTKTEFNKQDLANLIDDFLKTGDEKELTQYLISKSNLPGPRGNLELAQAFADLIAVTFSKNPERLWDLCIKAIKISSNEAPVNDPKEFLTFCGTYAIGAIGSVSSLLFDKALFLLKGLSRDSRWRTREAVAMGLQKMIARKPEETLNALDDWIENKDWLAMRAVVAGVAEPYLLRNVQTARKALEFHKKIFAKILATKERKSYEFKAMRKGLGYTFSVVICGLPKEGFRHMHKLASSQDVDILWIVKQNLRKNRLIRNFPDEVTSVKN